MNHNTGRSRPLRRLLAGAMLFAGALWLFATPTPVGRLPAPVRPTPSAPPQTVYNAPSASIVPTMASTSAPKATPRPSPSMTVVAGVSATWYCQTGVSRCTRGHPRGLYAAISPDLAYLRGKIVKTCLTNDPKRCVRVKIIDCNCQAYRAIDLYADAFLHLAPLSAGRLRGVELAY